MSTTYMVREKSAFTLPSIKELLDQQYSTAPILSFPSYTKQDRVTKKKRKRTTSEQLIKLQQLYDISPLPSSRERIHLGQQIDMSAREVQVWFQNRRQNQKKKVADISNGSSAHSSVYSSSTSSVCSVSDYENEFLVTALLSLAS
jgi:hypothetical protein